MAFMLANTSLDGQFRAEYFALLTVRSNPCFNGLKLSLMTFCKCPKYPQTGSSISLHANVKVKDFELLVLLIWILEAGAQYPKSYPNIPNIPKQM